MAVAKPSQKFDDRDKLLKLINDFPALKTMNELASVLYIIVKIYKGRFSYEPEDFEDFNLIGPTSRKLWEDLFHLEVREEYLSRRSQMLLTPKGKEKIKKLDREVNFEDVKSSLSQIDKDLWPILAAYLHLRDQYRDDKKIKEILQSYYEVDNQSWKTLKAFIKRQGV